MSRRSRAFPVRSGTGRAGLTIIVVVVGFCVVGPWLRPTDQVTTQIASVLQHPSARHALGTDPNGYDELGRLMLGGRNALVISVLAAMLATVFGTLYGAVAGFLGGRVDGFLMRIVDTLLAVPSLVLLLVVVSIFGADSLVLVVMLALFAWLVPARLVRAEALILRRADFIGAARIAGAGNARLITRHLIPNALHIVVVNASFQIADAFLALSALSYLGFGNGSISWGGMLSDGVDYSTGGAWWLLYPVAGMLVLTTLGFTLLGEGLHQDLIGAQSARPHNRQVGLARRRGHAFPPSTVAPPPRTPQS
jgi:peptide/nickel transport system permease protein